MYPSDEKPQQNETLLEIAKSEGEQTKVTEIVRKIADEIDPNNELRNIGLVQEVCAYVRTMLPKDVELKKLYEDNPELFFDPRTRTAKQLLSTDNLMPNRMRARNISGCIETALITRALLLAKGLPCVYTETLQKDWCENKAIEFDPDDRASTPMEGHVFVDVYIEDDKKWITVDPNDNRHTVHVYGDYTKNGKKYVFAKSAKDSWDLGYTKMKDFQKAVVSFFRYN